MKSIVPILQPLGRALMLPIAVLPIAGLLLRLGQPDLLGIPFVSAAGDAIFANLGLLFAIGVATALARDGNGAACLAGVVCFLVTSKGAGALLTLPPALTAGLGVDAAAAAVAAGRDAAIARLSVPIGILSGLIGGHFYNRFSTIGLPASLGFFGGRRFVPIASGLAGLALALAIGPIYGRLSSGIDALSAAAVGSGGIGLFVYGLLNRLLLVTGLHHILNNVVWFVVGDFHGKTGDLQRFFAGDPGAGAFMSGFFPVMMFGLPAACLAMYHEALPERRKATGGMLVSLALTSFLTGVTEPIEFSFMFLAPLLFGLHAVLTGVAMALMNALGVKLGFGFSAGLFDYMLNFGKATRPLLLLPVGAAYALIYYAVFRVAIRRLDLKTPGREPAEDDVATDPVGDAGGRGAAFVAALGGAGNLLAVGACTTRLRLSVADTARLDDRSLKALGARAVLRPGGQAVQVVIGPVADLVAVEMRTAMTADTPRRPAVEAPVPTAVDVPEPVWPTAVVEALGGWGNIRTLRAAHSRIVADLFAPDLIDAEALRRLGVRGTGRIGDILHLLFAPATIAGWIDHGGS